MVWAVRRAIQHSQESLRSLSKRYGINQKTVAKWKKRDTVTDLPTGPREPRSTVLSAEHEAVIVAFRRHTVTLGVVNRHAQESQQDRHGATHQRTG